MFHGVKYQNTQSSESSLVLRTLTEALGDRGSTMVKALCYKSEGRWFDSRWCHWIFH